jgi:hypothetical protein
MPRGSFSTVRGRGIQRGRSLPEEELQRLKAAEAEEAARVAEVEEEEARLAGEAEEAARVAAAEEAARVAAAEEEAARVAAAEEEAARVAAQRAQVEDTIKKREAFLNANPGLRRAHLTRPFQTNATKLSSGLSRQQRDARDEERYRRFLETHFSEGIISDQYPGTVFANSARNIPGLRNPSENGGGKQKKRSYTQTRTRQKKHRARRRRHSTRKYRK